MREFVVANGCYWVDEFHIDGFRIDATQNIYDFGEGEHILAEFTRRARETAGRRQILVVGENEPQATHLIRPRERRAATVSTPCGTTTSTTAPGLP